MRTGRYLLDTGIVAAHFRGDSEVAEKVGTADELFVSAVVVGELYYGAYNSRRSDDEIRKIVEFVRAVRILTCDVATAEVYGRIKTALRARGRPIPENDIWIAATAIQYDLQLAMRDPHFREVDGLQLAEW
jgi:tRNA(fMet)-specific endonuclease VapC